MARNIDVDAEIDSIRLDEQASTPVSPDTGYSHIFAKADGLYIVDDDDAVIGPLGGRVLIEEATPSGTGTVTFSDIPQNYWALRVECIGRSTRASSAQDTVLMEYNLDTTANNYRVMRHGAFGAGTELLGGSDFPYIGVIPAGDSPTNSAGLLIIDILGYANTTFNKQASSAVSFREDDSTKHETVINYALEWESTSAIATLVLSLQNGNFVAGSTIRLYGLN